MSRSFIHAVPFLLHLAVAGSLFAACTDSTEEGSGAPLGERDGGQTGSGGSPGAGGAPSGGQSTGGQSTGGQSTGGQSGAGGADAGGDAVPPGPRAGFVMCSPPATATGEYEQCDLSAGETCCLNLGNLGRPSHIGDNPRTCWSTWVPPNQMVTLPCGCTTAGSPPSPTFGVCRDCDQDEDCGDGKRCDGGACISRDDAGTHDSGSVEAGATDAGNDG